jgi:hypothetical protein
MSNREPMTLGRFIAELEAIRAVPGAAVVEAANK